MDNQNQPQNNQPQQFLLHQAQFVDGIIDPRMLAATPTRANGDLYYSDGSNFQRLAPGTTGQILTLSQGVPVWATPSAPSAIGFTSGCSVTLSANQSVTNGSFVKILFDTKAYDGLSEFSTLNSKFTATAAGRYLVTFNPVTSGITATQSILGAIYKNGSIAYNTSQTSNNIGASYSAQVTAIMNLAATDFIEFYVLQSDSAPRNFAGGATSTNAMLQRVL